MPMKQGGHSPPGRRRQDPRIIVSTVRQGSLSERSVSAARGLLTGQRGGLRAYSAFAGPAVVVSIALPPKADTAERDHHGHTLSAARTRALRSLDLGRQPH
jgi:hypothetical protein